MDEWPIICIARRHFGQPQLARGYFTTSQGDKYPYCNSCARRLGIDLKKQGYKWVELSSNQTIKSEREHTNGNYN